MTDEELIKRLGANAAYYQSGADLLSQAAERIRELTGAQPPAPEPEPPTPDPPQGGTIVWPGHGPWHKETLPAGLWRFVVNVKIPERTKQEWKKLAEQENLVVRVGPKDLHHQIYCRVNKQGKLGWQEGWKDPSKDPSWQHVDPKVPADAPRPTLREVAFEFTVALAEPGELHVGPDDAPVHDGVLSLDGWVISVKKERIA